MQPTIAATLVSFTFLIGRLHCQGGLPVDLAFQTTGNGARIGHSQAFESSAGHEPQASADEDRNAIVLDLVRQSHDASSQLSHSWKEFLLRRQIELVSKSNVDLARAWTQELYTLASEAKGAEQVVAQTSALRIMARLDPDRALDLLHGMGDEVPDYCMHSSKSEMAQEVFNLLVAREGMDVLPVLEQEALNIGRAGRYPYAALGSAAMQAVSKAWATNREHAISIVQPIFGQAVMRYSHETRDVVDDIEFGRMLEFLAGGLPHEVVQPALRTLVNNLLSNQNSKYHFQAEVFTSDGEKAKADNVIDATILHFGSLINRVDPDLARELQSRRPELQVALEYAKDGRQRSGVFGVGCGSRPQDRNTEIQSDAIRLSRINPEAAVAKAEQLPEDEKRSSTILEVARNIAGDQPDRARELIARSQIDAKTSPGQMQLSLLSAQASVAAAENRYDELRELLERGFALARQLVSAPQPHTPSLVGLSSMIQLGAQNELELTKSFIQGLPASQLKAEFLLMAAGALDMKTPLPFKSRMAPPVTKTAQ